MAISFRDIHDAIIAEAKEGIPFPYEMKPEENDLVPLEVIRAIKKPKPIKIKRIKRDISSEKVKDLILSKKKTGCSICGYDKCMSALEFHHVNPSEKSFAISKAHSGYSLNEILEELEKCVLVCANCHKEIHAGIVSI
jgi:hypothetical protein